MASSYYSRLFLLLRHFNVAFTVKSRPYWHKTRILRRFAGFSLGVSAIANKNLNVEFDWKRANIAEPKLQRHRDDVEDARRLVEKTLICANCRKRHAIDPNAPAPDVEYCACDMRRVGGVYGVKVASDLPWTPFLERRDLVVWRREHESQPGMFVYKMYGRFDDVTPNEFLRVQLDLTEFRLSWDVNTSQCSLLEEELKEDENSLSQIYYWEVEWPRFFSNRDYVCNRKTRIEGDVAVVYSEASSHAKAPKKTKCVRVSDYWSAMTVRSDSAESWDDLGVEFCLTAFENPGVSLPNYITTWVAIRAMPEFLTNLRKACNELREKESPTKSGEGGGKILLVSNNRNDRNKTISGIIYA